MDLLGVSPDDVLVRDYYIVKRSGLSSFIKFIKGTVQLKLGSIDKSFLKVSFAEVFLKKNPPVPYPLKVF